MTLRYLLSIGSVQLQLIGKPRIEHTFYLFIVQSTKTCLTNKMTKMWHFATSMVVDFTLKTVCSCLNAILSICLSCEYICHVKERHSYYLTYGIWHAHRLWHSPNTIQDSMFNTTHRLTHFSDNFLHIAFTSLGCALRKNTHIRSAYAIVMDADVRVPNKQHPTISNFHIDPNVAIAPHDIITMTS